MSEALDAIQVHVCTLICKNTELTGIRCLCATSVVCKYLLFFFQKGKNKQNEYNAYLNGATKLFLQWSGVFC